MLNAHKLAKRVDAARLQRLPRSRAAVELACDRLDRQLLLEAHADHRLLVGRELVDQGVDRVAQHAQLGLVLDPAGAGQVLVQLLLQLLPILALTITAILLLVLFQTPLQLPVL